jgi:hypothetical protein
MIDLDTHPRSYVHAPFTEEQVACIRAYQALNRSTSSRKAPR